MTELGIVGRAPHIVVDDAGVMSSLGGGAAVIDWWIGAEDRWHQASRETAVRQGIADDLATVETSMRIPGGDARHRVRAVPHAGSGVGVVEIRNDSPVPVAAALVVSVPPAALEVREDVVSVDGHPLIRADRSIARALVAADPDEARVLVEGGQAQPPAELDWPRRAATVAVLVPVPHTATVSFVVGHVGMAHLPAPDLLPPADAVARGWHGHIERGAQVSLPDDRVELALTAARRHLLSGSVLGPDDAFWSEAVEPWAPAVGAVALDAWGHLVEGRELLLTATGPDDLRVHATRPPAAAGALLWAWAERLERERDEDLEAALGPWIEQVAIGLLRKPSRFRRKRARPGDEAWRAVGLAAAASLLSRQGDSSIGVDIIDALPALIADIAPEPGSLALGLGGARLGLTPPALVEVVHRSFAVGDGRTVSAAAAAASATGVLGFGGRTQHPGVSALFLLALRRAVVDEPAGSGGPIVFCSSSDLLWPGEPLEAHGLPVCGGAASFGIRWHGQRPALLWDVVTDGGAVTVSAPAVDPGWSADAARGDALLTPADAVRLEPGPATPQAHRGDGLDVDDDPPSFA